MECSCEIDVPYDEGEPVRCHSAKTVKARKYHKCHECYRQINPNENYELASFICDGKWDAHKTCSDCLSLRKEFFSNGHIYGAIRPDIECHVDDMDGDIPESCISQLTPAAREWVCGKIEDRWEYLEERKNWQ